MKKDIKPDQKLKPAAPLEHEESDPGYRNRLNVRLSFVGSMLVLIIIAAILVSVGYYMYWKDSRRKYDIARPDTANSEQDIKVEDESLSDAKARVDASDAKQKIDFLNKETSALDAINKFDASDFTDQNLQLTPSDQPSL